MFPGEGSICLWTHKALGSFMGFFAGFCAWWPGILSIIVAGVVAVTFIQHLGSLFNASLLTAPWQQGVVIMLVLALSLVLSLIRFRVTQNIISTVFVCYGGATLLIGIAAVLAVPERPWQSFSTSSLLASSCSMRASLTTRLGACSSSPALIAVCQQ